MQFSIPAMAAAQQFFPHMAQNGFLNMSQAAGFFANQQGLQCLTAMTSAACNPVQQIASTVAPSPSTMLPTLAPAFTTTQQQAVKAPPVPSTAEQLQQSYMKAMASHPLMTTSMISSNPQVENNAAIFGGSAQRTSGNKGGVQTGGTDVVGGLNHVPFARSSSSHQGETQTNHGYKAGGTQTKAQMSSIPNQGAQMASGWYPSAGRASAQPPDVASRTASATNNPQSIHTRAPSSMTAIEQHQFPDFVAGFDKVALSIKPANTNVPLVDEQNTLQCSPPFTSRSFDELHRLLGKDLGPLDDGAAEVALPESPRPSERIEDKSTPEKFLDTSALFTAESYAMFAQESALAASQHAAYLAQDQEKVPPSGHQHLGSFDFDSAMRLLSQHAPVISRKDPAPLASLGPLATSPSNMDAKLQAFSTPFIPFQQSAKESDQIKKSSSTAAGVLQTRAIGRDAPVVSASEATSSATESSFRGSTSESNGSDNTFSNSDEGQFESGDDSNSSEDSFSYGDASESQNKRKKERDDSFSSSQFEESWNHHDTVKRKKRRLS